MEKPDDERATRLLRIPRRTDSALKLAAAREHRSGNAQAEHLIEEGLVRGGYLRPAGEGS